MIGFEPKKTFLFCIILIPSFITSAAEKRTTCARWENLQSLEPVDQSQELWLLSRGSIVPRNIRRASYVAGILGGAWAGCARYSSKGAWARVGGAMAGAALGGGSAHAIVKGADALGNFIKKVNIAYQFALNPVLQRQLILKELQKLQASGPAAEKEVDYEGIKRALLGDKEFARIITKQSVLLCMAQYTQAPNHDLQNGAILKELKELRARVDLNQRYYEQIKRALVGDEEFTRIIAKKSILFMTTEYAQVPNGDNKSQDAKKDGGDSSDDPWSLYEELRDELVGDDEFISGIGARLVADGAPIDRAMYLHAGLNTKIVRAYVRKYVEHRLKMLDNPVDKEAKVARSPVRGKYGEFQSDVSINVRR